MKKILSFILAALMTASCAAYVAADDAAVEETTSNAAQDYAIEFLTNYGIFKGGEGLTNEDPIERYQMALFVARISTGWTEDDKWEDGTANNSTFKDIDEEPASKYLGAISYANQNGIIEGYTANTFAPRDGITYRDALTMVVRTLGYKGLTYPWGYIEKAVELDLTEGIDSDVAYTDDLTRGEVATIIYNAMFADTAKGTTLAKSIFDCDFKWQNIVIVSSDEYTTIYDAEGPVFAKADYVGFKTIGDDATLGDKVYYVASADLDLTGHEEEQAVGTVYTALFKSVDGNYVTLLDYDANINKTVVVNNGITDNEGEPVGTMPIAATLAKYKLVKDYTNGFVNYTYDDLKVFGYETVKFYDEDGNATNVGIDMSNKNILKWVECTDKDSHGKAGHICGWVVEWYYNGDLDRYYQYEVKKTTDGSKANSVATDGEVYINWMSEPEFTEWYEEVVKKLVASYSELVLIENNIDAYMSYGKNPYSKLTMYDVNSDGTADIAYYKDYKIGIFNIQNSKYKCTSTDNGVNHSAGVYMPAYELTNLDGEVDYYAFVEDGHIAHDTNDEAGFAWVTVDPSVTTFVNEDGSYTSGAVVLYNVNRTTGEIEIVKHITDKVNDDDDSYIVTGLLQSYNTKTQKVVISGVEYPFAYPYLNGDMYAMANTGTVTRMLLADTFDAQYMQYVTAVVCDGYVVDTDLLGNTNASIVVLGYAGITSDGYIAVYGYKTDELTMKVFKINSYNGWKQGDYRYYPTNVTSDGAFSTGAMYEIKSYDAETESYGVYTENVESVLTNNTTAVKVTFKKGYRSVQPMSLVWSKENSRYEWVKATDANGKEIAPTITAVTSADKYVVVCDGEIFVYDGILDGDYSTYEVNGLMVGTDMATKTIVLYTLNNLNLSANIFEEGNDGWESADKTAGLFKSNAYDIGYVLYEKSYGKVLNAAYDDAQVDDWYLLGSTASEVTVFDLLNGTRNNVIAASNIDLVNGHIYKTYGNTILHDITDDCTNVHDFIVSIYSRYNSTDIDYADYIVATDVKGSHRVTVSKDTITDLDLALALNLEPLNGVTKANADATDKAIADKLIDNERRIYLVDTDVVYWSNVIDTNRRVTEVTAETLRDNYTYDADIVYNVKTGKTVIYIYSEGSKTGYNTVEDNYTVTKDNADKPMSKEFAVIDGRIFDLQTTYYASAEFDNENCLGDMKDFTIDKIVLEIKEAYIDADGNWAYKAIEECGEDGCAMHNAMSHVGCGLGVANIDEVCSVDINDKTIPVDDKFVVETCKDCGLAYKLVIDLTDDDINNDLIYEAEGELNCIAVRINNRRVSSFSIEAQYIINPDPDADTQHGSTFEGVNGSNYNVERFTTDLDLNAEAPEDDVVIW